MIVITLAFVIVFVVSITLFLNNTEQQMKDNIGRRIIMNKDTLIVTDYSIVFETYNLSNGSKVSKELLKTLKQVK